MKKYISQFVYIVVAIIVYFYLNSIINKYILLAVFSIITAFYIMYNKKETRKYTYFLDSMCDVEKHLKYIETTLKNKNQSLYNLYKTYGNIFNGDFENIEEDIKLIDTSVLDLGEKLLLEEIKLKLLYNNNDAVGYSELLVVVLNGDYAEDYELDLITLKTPLYLLNKQYEELAEVLFEIIPVQKKSYRVIELEYYLALAYIELGKSEDAIAVLEFITKRDLKIDFVTKSKLLLEEIKDI